ncbi:hypothetical protein Syun_002786 [Stephania yunnanensis]|uniref:Homeobox domain-containing protein n=1 Tax=Stephania yunnanensis TaxID=152371 RepID=A0AAP0LGE9_9MAGN
MDERPPEYYNARFHGLARTLEAAGGRTSSRWSPKPEQILILESIFNSGMTNPPKDETARIRRMLQEFGSVGDANVFYWFQNRRSRLRRQQRHALHAHNIIMMSNMTISMSDVDGSGGGNGIFDSTGAGGGSAGDHICSAAPDRPISLGASSSAPHPHPVGIVNHKLSSSSTSPQMKETMEHSHEDALGFGLFYHDRASFMDSYQRAAAGWELFLGSETKLNASTANQKGSSICPSHKHK